MDEQLIKPMSIELKKEIFQNSKQELYGDKIIKNYIKELETLFIFKRWGFRIFYVIFTIIFINYIIETISVLGNLHEVFLQSLVHTTYITLFWSK